MGMDPKKEDRPENGDGLELAHFWTTFAWPSFGPAGSSTVLRLAFGGFDLLKLGWLTEFG
jgi:hypothetical protein